VLCCEVGAVSERRERERDVKEVLLGECLVVMFKDSNTCRMVFSSPSEDTYAIKWNCDTTLSRPATHTTQLHKEPQSADYS
jgi:hypothetical protein